MKTLIALILLAPNPSIGEGYTPHELARVDDRAACEILLDLKTPEIYPWELLTCEPLTTLAEWRGVLKMGKGP